MGTKCIRKFIMLVMMMGSLIPAVIVVPQVHANNVASTSFRPSSLPIVLGDFSEVDNFLGPLGGCLKKNIGRCKQWKSTVGNKHFVGCINPAFEHCVLEHRHSGDPIRPIMENCTFECLERNHGIIASILWVVYLTAITNISKSPHSKTTNPTSLSRRPHRIPEVGFHRSFNFQGN